ncbi:MAG: hypothetical protein LBQ20_12490, partial [Rhodanobacter sp.]|nr:hypothetical protein [Rhodanobacter sp.]
AQWGDKWQSAGKPPIVLSSESGEPLAPMRVTTRTGKPVEVVRFSPGPGANARTRAFFARHAQGSSSPDDVTR